MLQKSLLVSFVVLSSFSSVSAQTIGTINFQGKVVRDSGLNVSSSETTCIQSGTDTCGFQMAYYSASSGGTLLGTETFTNVEIGDYGGVVNLALGTGSFSAGGESSFANIFANNNAVYAELRFDHNGNASYTEVFGRLAVRGAAFAMRSSDSAALGGRSSSGYVQLAPGSVQTDSSTSSSIFINKTGGSGNILQLQRGGSDVMTIANSGAITLGNNSSTVEINSSNWDVSTSGAISGLINDISEISFTDSLSIKRPILMDNNSNEVTSIGVYNILKAGSLEVGSMFSDLGSIQTLFTDKIKVDAELFIGKTNVGDSLSDLKNKYEELNSMGIMNLLSDYNSGQLFEAYQATFTSSPTFESIISNTASFNSLIVGTELSISSKGSLTMAGDLYLSDIKISSYNGMIFMDSDLSVKNITAQKINITQDSLENASAGNSIIPINKTEIRIDTTAVTVNSLIFITPRTYIGSDTLYVSEQDDGYFIVKMGEIKDKEVEFNWWVIN